MNVDGIKETLDKFVRDYLRDIHTIKPARVTAVNHGQNTLSADIMTSTYHENDTNIPQPTVEDVPYFILSAGMGSAKITMPINVGDLVVILFSDRDYADYLLGSGNQVRHSTNPATHNYDPLIAFPCFFTQGVSTEVSDTDIVIQNAGTEIRVAPDGDIRMNTTANIQATAAAVNVISPTSTLHGNLIVNGNINATGNVSDGIRSMQGDRAIYNAHTTHPPGNQ